MSSSVLPRKIFFGSELFWFTAMGTIFQGDRSLTFSWTKEGMGLWLLDPPQGKELFLATQRMIIILKIPT